jgi:hypothetical protein
MPYPVIGRLQEYGDIPRLLRDTVSIVSIIRNLLYLKGIGMRCITAGTIAIVVITVGVFGYRTFLKTADCAADEIRRPVTGGNGGGFLLAQELKTKGDGKWVAKIDDTTITTDEFEREFGVHVYSLPIDEAQKNKYKDDPANKKKFLANLINEYLIYKKALKERYDKRSDVQDLLKAVERRAIIQVYLNDKIEPKLTDIPDEQIETIYNQNKKLFAGVDIDVARQQIRMQLLHKQYNDYLNELIDSLKGEAKVVKNSDLNL